MNMNYCRMENTYRDLLDCCENWDETESQSELKYREKILKVCKEIVIAFDDGGE